MTKRLEADDGTPGKGWGIDEKRCRSSSKLTAWLPNFLKLSNDPTGGLPIPFVTLDNGAQHRRLRRETVLELVEYDRGVIGVRPPMTTDVPSQWLERRAGVYSMR